MNKLYIIIPAYNESVNITQVIKDWYKIIEKSGDGGSKLVIINDGSLDDTYEISRSCQKERPDLVVLTKENSGHGATLLYGYEYALAHHADYIFQTDSDGQTLPEEFDAFWKLRDEYDLIIGHRKGRRDGVSRVIVTKVLRYVLYFCFGTWVMDANTPFRLMNAQSLQNCIGKVPRAYNLTNVLLSVLYEKSNYKVKYLPITFRERQGGVNSINLRKLSLLGIKAIQDFSIIRRTV